MAIPGDTLTVEKLLRARDVLRNNDYRALYEQTWPMPIRHEGKRWSYRLADDAFEYGADRAKDMIRAACRDLCLRMEQEVIEKALMSGTRIEDIHFAWSADAAPPWRFAAKTPTYGRSPADIALPDIRAFQATTKLRLKEKPMHETRKSINIDRVANGWIVRPHTEERYVSPLAETEVARTPAELGKLVEAWAKAQIKPATTKRK